MRLIPVRLRLLATAALVIAAFAAQAAAQPEPSGGRISPEPPPTVKVKPKKAPAKTPVRNTPTVTPENTRRPTSTTAAVDRIDGKWWTTGNGFGDSEVVFTQNGPQVTGTIRYADGRNGTLTGTLVGKRLNHTWTNSSGDGGSGWLELSWTNFLGGPWRNQRVRDGSWTLNRIEGKWCFGGRRDRIRTVTHDARGRILLVSEDGTRDEGRLQGPRIFLDSEYGSIEGTMYFKANRIDWSTGFFWTWCGR
ncbi:MAG: hypothetical protein ABR568_06385 [Pyrinomonadaceae bacterium]